MVVHIFPTLILLFFLFPLCWYLLPFSKTSLPPPDLASPDPPGRTIPPPRYCVLFWQLIQAATQYPCFCCTTQPQSASLPPFPSSVVEGFNPQMGRGLSDPRSFSMPRAHVNPSHLPVLWRCYITIHTPVFHWDHRNTIVLLFRLLFHVTHPFLPHLHDLSAPSPQKHHHGGFNSNL